MTLPIANWKQEQEHLLLMNLRCATEDVNPALRKVAIRKMLLDLRRLTYVSFEDVDLERIVTECHEVLWGKE